MINDKSNVTIKKVGQIGHLEEPQVATKRQEPVLGSDWVLRKVVEKGLVCGKLDMLQAS